MGTNTRTNTQNELPTTRNGATGPYTKDQIGAPQMRQTPNSGAPSSEDIENGNVMREENKIGKPLVKANGHADQQIKWQDGHGGSGPQGNADGQAVAAQGGEQQVTWANGDVANPSARE